MGVEMVSDVSSQLTGRSVGVEGFDGRGVELLHAVALRLSGRCWLLFTVLQWKSQSAPQKLLNFMCRAISLAVRTLLGYFHYP